MITIGNTEGDQKKRDLIIKKIDLLIKKITSKHYFRPNKTKLETFHKNDVYLKMKPVGEDKGFEISNTR